MQIGARVEYQTGNAAFGVGNVTGFELETDTVTVIDLDDGSTWTGPADRATPICKY